MRRLADELGTIASALHATSPAGLNYSSSRSVASLLTWSPQSRRLAAAHQSAVHTADLIPQFVSVSIYKASMLQQRVEREPAYFAQLDRSMAALPRARFPAIAELLLELTATEAPDARTRGLDVLVCGLAALAPPAPTPRRPPRGGDDSATRTTDPLGS